eukprot:g27653.t1
MLCVCRLPWDISVAACRWPSHGIVRSVIDHRALRSSMPRDPAFALRCRHSLRVFFGLFLMNPVTRGFCTHSFVVSIFCQAGIAHMTVMLGQLDHLEPDRHWGHLPVHQLAWYEHAFLVLDLRALHVADIRRKTTSTTQTAFSHLRRENETQVYLPKDVATNTTASRGTNPPRLKKYFVGLRGVPQPMQVAECRYDL